MHTIQARRLITTPWRHLTDDEVLPAGPVTVSLARWQRQRAVLLGRYRPVGVRLEAAESVAELAQDLTELVMVVLEFDDFAEGRGFSQARLLRECHGFSGLICARGARRDHLALMARCGVDLFELTADQDPAGALAAFTAIPYVYQPAADGRTAVIRRHAQNDPGGARDTPNGAET